MLRGGPELGGERMTVVGKLPGELPYQNCPICASVICRDPVRHRAEGTAIMREAKRLDVRKVNVIRSAVVLVLVAIIVGIVAGKEQRQQHAIGRNGDQLPSAQRFGLRTW